MRTLDLNKVQYEKLEEDDEDGDASGSQKESASEGAFLVDFSIQAAVVWLWSSGSRSVVMVVMSTQL